MSADIHTCSYQCQRPACVLAQRDDLVKRSEADAAEIVRLHGEVSKWQGLAEAGVTLAENQHRREQRAAAREAIAPAEAKNKWAPPYPDAAKDPFNSLLSTPPAAQVLQNPAAEVFAYMNQKVAEEVATFRKAAPVQAAPQEGAPRWVDDCQGKASYDGALVSVSVRTWPGNYSADNRPSGKIDVLRLGKVVQSIEVSADTETQLRAEIESKVAKLAAHPSACELGAVREALDHAEGRLAHYSLLNPRDTELSCAILPMVRRAKVALQHRGDSRGGEAKS